MHKFSLPMCLVVLLLSACNKHDPTPDNSPQLCQITKMDNKYSSNGSYLALFEYDAKGNPLAITIPDPEFPTQDYRFRHDKQNRITDIIYGYFTGTLTNRFSKWQRLKYDNKNRVSIDSIYYGGMVGDNPIIVPDIYSFIHVAYFTYDAKDRIIKETDTYRYQSMGELSYRDILYYYGPGGNLDTVQYGVPHSNGASTQYYKGYDSLVNIRRTNPLWQFMDRDYSVNNAIVTSAPNKYKLPTKMVGTRADQHLYFLDLGATSVMDIEYACK